MRATSKDIEKVCIKPASYELREIARAVKMRNELALMGFTSRMAFKQIASHYYPKYATKEGDKTLTAWWLFRLKDAVVNDNMENVISKLRHE